jgi:hypothetical protein
MDLGDYYDDVYGDEAPSDAESSYADEDIEYQMVAPEDLGVPPLIPSRSGTRDIQRNVNVVNRTHTDSPMFRKAARALGVRIRNLSAHEWHPVPFETLDMMFERLKREWLVVDTYIKAWEVTMGPALRTRMEVLHRRNVADIPNSIRQAKSGWEILAAEAPSAAIAHMVLSRWATVIVETRDDELSRQTVCFADIASRLDLEREIHIVVTAIESWVTPFVAAAQALDVSFLLTVVAQFSPTVLVAADIVAETAGWKRIGGVIGSHDHKSVANDIRYFRTMRDRTHIFDAFFL